MAATLLNIVAGSAAMCSSPVTHRLSVAKFNGLKASPTLKQGLARPAPLRSLTITAVADEKTLTTVQSIIAKQLVMSEAKVLPESKFADLGADSLDTVEIMMALEEEFKVSLDEDNAEKVSSVQEAADLIHSICKNA